MSIEVLRIMADRFEELGILYVDSKKVGELISGWDDVNNLKIFRPFVFNEITDKGLNNTFFKVWDSALRNNVKQ